MLFSKHNLKLTLENYLLGVALYSLGLLFYFTNDYYIGFIRKETKTTLITIYIAYLVIAPVCFLFLKNKRIEENKNYVLFKAIQKLIASWYNYIKLLGKHHEILSPKLEKYERTIILFLMVKLFFTPLMINFFFNNYFSSINNFKSLQEIDDLESFVYLAYPFALTFIFLIDTLWFSFGYVFEAKFLGNKIRSVEPTFLGWFVALASYPPFNTVVTKFFNWGPNENIVFGSFYATAIARSLIILCLIVYLWATISLGTKCSNLTNRGIVTTGAYAWIRHPAYIGKNLSWWIMLIPIMSWYTAFNMAIWSFIYFMRAITEERHLMQDPEYVEYCKKVKYRFIPGVY